MYTIFIEFWSFLYTIKTIRKYFWIHFLALACNILWYYIEITNNNKKLMTQLFSLPWLTIINELRNYLWNPFVSFNYNFSVSTINFVINRRFWHDDVLIFTFFFDDMVNILLFKFARECWTLLWIWCFYGLRGRFLLDLLCFIFYMRKSVENTMSLIFDRELKNTIVHLSFVRLKIDV